MTIIPPPAGFIVHRPFGGRLGHADLLRRGVQHLVPPAETMTTRAPQRTSSAAVPQSSPGAGDERDASGEHVRGEDGRRLRRHGGAVYVAAELVSPTGRGERGSAALLGRLSDPE